MRNLIRGFVYLIRLAFLVIAYCGIAPSLGAPEPESPRASSAPALGEALQWLSATPRFDAEDDFEMTVEIRLLFFWTGKGDVGGGFIKIGHAASDPDIEVIRLLFGSDPAKARGINRWGAGTEAAKHGPAGTVESSAFFGFMKSSKGESVGAMKQELSNEKQQGRHRFEAIIGRVDPGRAVSATVPFYSDRDFDFRQFEPAERAVLQQVRENEARTYHALDRASAGCSRSNGFLSTVQELAKETLQSRQGAASLCYIFNSSPYTLTLDAVRSVPEKGVHFILGD